MATTSRMINVGDVVAELLREEQSGLFHFMTTADPYINRAAAEVRRPLQEMVDRQARLEGELVAMLEQLGGVTRPIRVNSEHQYLGYLSVDFLLPRLVEAKRQSVQRYQRALAAIPAGETQVAAVLEGQLGQHLADLATLNTAVAHVAGSGRAGSQKPSPAHDPAHAR